MTKAEMDKIFGNRIVRCKEFSNGDEVCKFADIDGQCMIERECDEEVDEG